MASKKTKALMNCSDKETEAQCDTGAAKRELSQAAFDSPQRTKKHKSKKDESCEFVRRYINIYSRNISPWLSGSALQIDLCQPSLSCFKADSHKEQYVCLQSEIEEHIKFLHVKSEQHQKRLRVECCLCNKLILAKKAKQHCATLNHLISIMEHSVSKKNKRFLDKSFLRCSLCDTDLYEEACLDLEHFESKWHVGKLEEYRGNQRTSKKEIRDIECENASKQLAKNKTSKSISEKSEIKCSKSDRNLNDLSGVGENIHKSKRVDNPRANHSHVSSWCGFGLL